MVERFKEAYVGAVVHFIAEGDLRMRCMAAIVTNVLHLRGEEVSLVVFGYWTGEQFFHENVYPGRPATQETGWHWPGPHCIPAGKGPQRRSDPDKVD